MRWSIHGCGMTRPLGGTPGRMIGAVLPGMPQLLGGRWGAGGMVLSVWTLLLAIAVTRMDRVMSAAAGAWEAGQRGAASCLPFLRQMLAAERTSARAEQRARALQMWAREQVQKLAVWSQY